MAGRYGLDSMRAAKISDNRVPSHDLFFAWIKAIGLVENQQGNAGFADVMKGCRDSQSLYIQTGEPDLQRKPDCHSRHQQTMLEGSFVIAAYVVEPGGKPFFRNAVDDFQSGALGIRQVYLFAGPYRRKHRREGRRALCDLG